MEFYEHDFPVKELFWFQQPILSTQIIPALRIKNSSW